jgi:hypothetical protein
MRGREIFGEEGRRERDFLGAGKKMPSFSLLFLFKSVNTDVYTYLWGVVNKCKINHDSLVTGRQQFLTTAYIFIGRYYIYEGFLFKMQIKILS